MSSQSEDAFEEACERLQEDDDLRDLFERMADADLRTSERFQRALELAGVRDAE
ncbi:hypothetical protein JCM17823_14690 [Halorubrum gandharaense]